MEDEKIIALYWQRDQSAIDETDRKYGVQLRGLSYGILSDREDAEECVSDTYMAVWNSLPPQRPKRLRAYAAAIVRNRFGVCATGILKSVAAVRSRSCWRSLRTVCVLRPPLSVSMSKRSLPGR